jgi:hypothetical protein
MIGRFRPLVAATLALSLASSMIPLAAIAAPKPGVSDEDRKKAIEFYKQGQAFQEAEEALGKFEEVAKIVMTPGTRFNIALCKENLGRLLEALDDYSAAERDAKAEKKAETEKKAHDSAEALKARIPKLVLKVPSGLDGLSITLDGKPIDPANLELSVDPGKHKIEASADKRVPYSAEITVAEKESKDVKIRLPEQPKDEAPKDETPKDETPKKDESGSRKVPTVAYIVGGAGAVSLLGAGVFYLLRSSAKSKLDSSCDATTLVCPADQQSNIDGGKRYTLLTNIFMVVGVVGIGTGITLWATAPKGTIAPSKSEEPKAEPKTDEPKSEPKSEEPAASLRLVPYAPGANLGGIALTATF